MGHVENRFLPTTDQDRTTLLNACGVSKIEDLLVGIPESARFNQKLPIPEALSELEIKRKINEYFCQSKSKINATSYLGAGVYDHYCPAVVNQMLLRGEFLTSYTPYQAEMSQGTLKALFEFQSMIAQIFGMEISNASHYDGSTSMAEAALMALRIKNDRKKILVSQGVHPEYLEVLKTYVTNLGVEVCIVPTDETGTTSLKALDGLLGQDVAIFIAQSPNFYGCVEDIEELTQRTHKHESLINVSVTEPLSLAVLKTPGECNVDIATGEGQSFGIPQSFGGPYVGLFATKQSHVRQVPGRLCGESIDAQGRTSYTLTLSTREQHIRREKATSNICTNQNLCALWSTVWLALMGKEGFYNLAQQNLSKSEYAKSVLTSVSGVNLRYKNALNFNEFLIDLKCDAENFVAKCVQEKTMPGLPMSRFNPQDKTGLLICVTEQKTKGDIDNLVSLFSKFNH